MDSSLSRFREFILNPSHSRTLTALVILIIAAAIPLTVLVAQQQQNTRQQAATCNANHYYCGSNLDATLNATTNKAIYTGNRYITQCNPSGTALVTVKDCGTTQYCYAAGAGKGTAVAGCTGGCSAHSGTYGQFFCSTSCSNSNQATPYYCPSGTGTCCSKTPTPSPTPVGQTPAPTASTTPPTWYNSGGGTYNTYTHIHPIPGKTGDACTSQGAQYMCSSIPAITANGEASATGNCPYVSGDIVTLDGTQYKLAMSYNNYCITIPDNLVPTPPASSATGTSTAQYCTSGTCINTTGGGNCVVFSKFSWTKPPDAATTPNYKLSYKVDTDTKNYGPYSATTTSLITPFKVGTINNGTFPQCTNTNNGDQSGTGYACGFLQGKQVTWSVAYTKKDGTGGTIKGAPFTTATCQTSSPCTVAEEVKPHLKCNATTNVCELDQTCGTNSSDCSGKASGDACGNIASASPTTSPSDTGSASPSPSATPGQPTCTSSSSNLVSCTTCTATQNYCGPSGTQACTCTDSSGTKYTNYTATCNSAAQNCNIGNTCPNGQNDQQCTAPSGSPSPSGSGTPGPTATPAPGDTLLALTVGIDAIGSTGDNENSNSSSSNKNPLTPTRRAEVFVFDSSNKKVADKLDSINYNKTTGLFAKTINLGGGFVSGNYTVKVRSDGHLTRLISGIQKIVSGTTNTMPRVNLIAGDLNGDNAIDIRDYNIFVSCSIFSETGVDYSPNAPFDGGVLCDTAGTNYQALSDMDDNGVIDQVDYNLFIREYSVQNGN